jgi:nitrate/TMAO reductase-like tetraheme cytochrome c subunit
MNNTTLARWIAIAALVGLPAVARAQAAKPPVMAHEVAGREKCLTCHAAGAAKDAKAVPATHKDRGDETCLWCHAKDAAVQTKASPEIKHALQGRTACMVCHKVGVMPAVPDVPADHQGRTDKQCLLCHQPKAG